MNLEFTSEDKIFRERARDWLHDNVFRTQRPHGGEEMREYDLAWQKCQFDGGWAGVSWPTEYGGLGLDLTRQLIWYEEYARAQAPDNHLCFVGLNHGGPTIIARGDDAQKREHLRPILSGEKIWCQGFSEPNAGSDLAALRTRAVVDGDELVITGSKIWTSHGHLSDMQELLVRTDPDAPKHKGITFLMLDRHSPGVEVRPIRQMNHQADFAELFFTDVEVPVANVIGGIDNGWRVAMATLTHERSSNLNTAAHFHQVLAEVLALVPENLRRDPVVRLQIARFHEEIEAYRYITLRTLSSLSTGKQPGPQSAMGKLWWSEMQTRIFEFGLSMLGERAELLEPTPGEKSALIQSYWLSRASHIYAGSNEIQRNIISERVLGLPKGN
jgi:alkylation response protein AidB-like acyl-CoA dehydrogenase